MKTKYFILSIIVLIAGAMLTGCNDNRDKSENDKDDVKQGSSKIK